MVDYLKILLLVTVTLIWSCQTRDKVAEYMKWNEGENAVREYVNYPTDTTMRRIFARQSFKPITGAGWEFEYEFQLFDSFPLQKARERYYDNNDYELLALSLFEADLSGKAVEIPGEMVKGKKHSANHSPVSCSFIFRYKVDSAFVMKVNSEVSYNFQLIDSLNMEGLIINSRDTFSFIYSDERHDTVVHQNTTKLYEKGKGLIQFSTVIGNNTTTYKLKE